MSRRSCTGPRARSCPRSRAAPDVVTFGTPEVRHWAWRAARSGPTIGADMRSRLAVRTFPIVDRAVLSPTVARLTIEAPRIAQIRQPGRFVIVRRGPGAERIPLTIADGDAAAGTITLVIQAVGKSTADLVDMQVGEAVTDVA